MGSITINGKNVKQWVIGGKTVKSLTVGGKALTLIQQVFEPNSFVGTFGTTEAQNAFLNAKSSVPDNKFAYEYLTQISMPGVVNIGSRAFYSSRLSKIYIPRATTIGNDAFHSVVNSNLTQITMNKKFDTADEKNRIFGFTWWKITFHWTNDDGTPA